MTATHDTETCDPLTEEFKLSADRIIEIGAGSYDSYEDQFRGSNSPDGNLSLQRLKERFEQDREMLAHILTTHQPAPAKR